MMKFKFKLETVLQVKIRLEDMRKKELHEAELRREKAAKQVLRAENEVAKAVDLYREKLQQSLDLYLANQYHKFIAWLNTQVVSAKRQLQEREFEVAERRAKLIEASREKKVIEKLKEKAYQDYLAAESNAEIKFLDELGTGRFVRRPNSNH